MRAIYRVPVAFEVEAESRDEAYERVWALIAARDADKRSTLTIVIGPRERVEEWKDA